MTRRACTTLIHSDRAEVDAWLDDHRTLGQLARKRGWTSQRKLAHALVAPRLKAVRPAMRAVLERRALETLTQGHLSNHMIFHVFHTPAIADHAKSVFGLRPATFRHLRDSGLSPAVIAQRGGRTRAGAQARLAALLKARGQRAVSLGAMSRAQAQGALRRADGGAARVHAPHLPHAVAAGQLPLPAALSQARGASCVCLGVGDSTPRCDADNASGPPRPTPLAPSLVRRKPRDARQRTAAR